MGGGGVGGAERGPGAEPAAEPPPIRLLVDRGIEFRLHRHAPVRSSADYASSGFPIELSVKTLAFALPDGRLVLVALPGASRLAYGALAREVGVARSRLATASADELAGLGMQPGGVCPFTEAAGVAVVIDAPVLDLPVIYCGSGDPASTVELAPDALRAACQDARIAAVSAPAATGNTRCPLAYAVSASSR